MLVLSCVMQNTFKIQRWVEIWFSVTFHHYTKTCEFVFNMFYCCYYSREAGDISPGKGAQRGRAGPHWTVSERWVHAAQLMSYTLSSFDCFVCMHPSIQDCMVTSCLSWYFSGVCKLYSEQRAIRVKRMVDKKRLWVYLHTSFTTFILLFRTVATCKNWLLVHLTLCSVVSGPDWHRSTTVGWRKRRRWSPQRRRRLWRRKVLVS